MKTVGLSALAVLVSSVLAVDLTHELNSGWRMGLRPRQASVQNLQTFTGAVGGARASAVSRSCRNEIESRGFLIVVTDHQLWRPRQAIRGGRGYLRMSFELAPRSGCTDEHTFPDTFAQNDFPTAANRACDNQKNNCAQLANSGAGFEVRDCDKQSGMSPGCDRNLLRWREPDRTIRAMQGGDKHGICDELRR
jgi:hypothetical protein